MLGRLAGSGPEALEHGVNAKKPTVAQTDHVANLWRKLVRVSGLTRRSRPSGHAMASPRSRSSGRKTRTGSGPPAPAPADTGPIVAPTRVAVKPTAGGGWTSPPLRRVRPAKARRQPHGPAWHWKQPDGWYPLTGLSPIQRSLTGSTGIRWRPARRGSAGGLVPVIDPRRLVSPPAAGPPHRPGRPPGVRTRRRGRPRRAAAPARSTRSARRRSAIPPGTRRPRGRAWHGAAARRVAAVGNLSDGHPVGRFLNALLEGSWKGALARQLSLTY